MATRAMGTQFCTSRWCCSLPLFPPSTLATIPWKPSGLQRVFLLTNLHKLSFLVTIKMRGGMLLYVYPPGRAHMRMCKQRCSAGFCSFSMEKRRVNMGRSFGAILDERNGLHIKKLAPCVERKKKWLLLLPLRNAPFRSTDNRGPQYTPWTFYFSYFQCSCSHNLACARPTCTACIH